MEYQYLFENKNRIKLLFLHTLSESLSDAVILSISNSQLNTGIRQPANCSVFTEQKPLVNSFPHLLFADHYIYFF